ncbi:MAG: Ig-like domain-containing protein [Thermoplasmata archaeon]|nr:Ig-like domain-containing protein [Thermoplasmata archaeon]
MWKNWSKVFGMGIAIACILSILPLPAVTAAPSLTVTPGTGIVGSLVIVNGTGFGSSQVVNIYWDSTFNLRNSTTTTTTGTFSVPVIIPSASGGKHTIIAKDAGGNQATAQFTVIPSLTISPSSGYVGEDVTLTLNGFGANLEVEFYWDGDYWTSDYTNNVGSRTVTLKLPELTGGYHVLSAVDAKENTGSTQFLVFSTFALDPSQGRYGDSVNFEGTGFGSGTEVKLYMDNQSNYLASAYTTPGGNFSGSFTVPQMPGGLHTVLAVDSSGNSGSANFEILPLVSLSKYTGYVDDEVSVYGYGYTANKNISVLWDSVQIPTAPDTVAVSSGGWFRCKIKVPYTPYGVHVVTAVDEGGLSHSVSFSVYPRISVDPDHGLPGIFASVNGTGFSANVSVSLFWDFGLPNQQGLGATVTNATGSFSHQVQIPSDQNGVHTIMAKDTNWHIAITAFYLGPSLLIANSTGNVGSSNTISGYVFSPAANVTVYWDAEPIGTARTDSSGDFTFSFVIPPSCYGAHTVSAVDEYGVHAETQFFVVPEISVVPASGTVGSTVAITGTGFSGNSIASIYWDGTNTYRSERTAQNGSFNLAFTVPDAAFGPHTIGARDIGGVTASAQYSVIPSIELSRTSGRVGDTFTVFCHGFAPSSPVTLVWDNVSTIYYSMTTDTGFAEIYSNVPDCHAGPHEIYVYDGMLHAVQPLPFTVLPLDAPEPIAPSGFVNATSVRLSWTAIQNASFYIGQISTDPLFSTNVIQFSTTSTGYQVTGLIHGNRYYWRVKAVDVAGNEGSFSASPDFTVDLVTPSSLLTGPGYTGTSPFTLGYTASDALSGIASVALYYSFNFSDFVLYGESTVSNGTFSFTAPYGDGTYRFYTVARDKAGNAEPVSGAKLTVVVDTKKPSAFVSPLPQISNTRILELNVVCGDTASGVSHFMLLSSTDNGSTWEFYGNYTTSPVQFIAGREGKYLFQAIAVDYAGNVEEMGPAEAWTFVDLTEPAVYVSIEGILGNDGWYLSSVKVMLGAADATGVKLYYSLNYGNWCVYTAPFTLAEDGIHNLACYAVDAAGNINSSLNIQVKVDRTAPVTQHSQVPEWSNGTHTTINFTATDSASGVKFTKVRIDDGEWITLNTGSGTSPLTVIGNGVHRIRYFSLDVGGNPEQEREFYVRIDAVAPGTELTVSGVSGKNGWFVSAVKVQLTSTDGLSGVAGVYYSIDNSTFRQYTAPVEIIAEGMHLIEYYAVDVAGNLEARKAVTVKIDTTMPSSTINMSGGWYRTLPVNLTINAMDGVSGLAGMYYSINGLPWVKGTIVSLDTDGAHTIRYYSVDNAGNAEEVKYVVVQIDAEAPETEAILSGNLSQNGWYTGTVLVTLEAEDGVSGVSDIFFSVDGSQVFDYTGPIVLTGDGVHILCYYAVDRAGNLEEEKTLTIGIDSTAPETTINASSGWYSQTPVMLALAAVDGTSGVAVTFYRVEGGEWKTGVEINLTEDGVYTVEFYSVDIAGNLERSQRVTVRIDSSAPAVELRGLPTERKSVSGTIQVSFGVSDLSGISRATYSIDGTARTLVAVGNLYSLEIDTTSIGDGTHGLVIEITDNAGHSTRITRTIRVDNTPPAIASCTPSEGAVVTGEVNIVLLLTDEAEITEIALYLDSKPVTFEREGGTVKYNWKTTIADNGRHVLKVYAKDAAGNLKVYEQGFSVNNIDFAPYIATGALIAGLAAACAGLISFRKPSRLVRVAKVEIKEKVEDKEVKK